jgi:hypothetical protein
VSHQWVSKKRCAGPVARSSQSECENEKNGHL